MSVCGTPSRCSTGRDRGDAPASSRSAVRAAEEMIGTRSAIPSRPAGYAVTRMGVSLSRSMSSPDGVFSGAGLPAHKLCKDNPAVQVTPTAPCLTKKKDAILGYRGFIPGKRSETVYGAGQTHANVVAHTIRPHPGPQTFREPGDEYNWYTAPDAPQRRRDDNTAAEWAKHHQACPPTLNGGVQTRSYGSAMQGYCGHRSIKMEKSCAGSWDTHTLGHTHALGSRLELGHTMTTDRDCQPMEVHRAAIPGYSGHIRGRHVS